MQRDGRFPRAIDITGAGGNRRAWPLQVVLDWYEERKGCAIRLAVTQPDKLKREQVEDAAVELSARHMSNILGEKVSADDVVIGSVKQLSPADAQTVGYTRWLALWLAIEGQMSTLDDLQTLSVVYGLFPAMRPALEKKAIARGEHFCPPGVRPLDLALCVLAGPDWDAFRGWAQRHNKRASST